MTEEREVEEKKHRAGERGKLTKMEGMDEIRGCNLQMRGIMG